MFLLNKCAYTIPYIPFMISRTSLCCFWVAKFRQLNLQYVYDYVHPPFTDELLDFQLLDSNSTIDLLMMGMTRDLHRGSWHVMGFCIPRNFGSIYLLLQCTAAEVCVKSVLKISELSHLLWVTQVESLNLSHSCWVTWAQEYTKYVKNHFHISSLWTLNLEGFDN